METLDDINEVLDDTIRENLQSMWDTSSPVRNCLTNCACKIKPFFFLVLVIGIILVIPLILFTFGDTQPVYKIQRYHRPIEVLGSENRPRQREIEIITEEDKSSAAEIAESKRQWMLREATWEKRVKKLQAKAEIKRIKDKNPFQEDNGPPRVYGHVKKPEVAVSRSLKGKDCPIHSQTSRDYVNEICGGTLKEDNRTDITSLTNMLTTCLPQNDPYNFRDVLLVIMFNNPHFVAIQGLELMYRRNFPNMVYCGPKNKAIQKYREDWGIDFIELIPENEQVAGELMNEQCIVTAMERYTKVAGYLFIHDDLVVNFWNLDSYDKSKVWTTNDWVYQPIIADFTSMKSCKMYTHRLGCYQGIAHWIYPDRYKDGVLWSLREIHNATRRNSSLSVCSRTLRQTTKDTTRSFYGQSDMYYVPQRLAPAFAEVVKIFLKNEVFFEIAIPTALHCIEPMSLHQVIPFRHNIWTHKIDTWRFYHRLLGDIYFHPLKLGMHLRPHTERLRHFCMEILPTIVKHSHHMDQKKNIGKYHDSALWRHLNNPRH